MEESRNLTTEEKASYEKLPVPFGIFSVHKTSFELLVISDGFCSLFGAERSAFGASCKEILKRHIHPDDYEKFRPDIQRACLQPNGEYSAVYRIRANETDYRWISVKGCVQQQEDGSYFLYVYFTDVHDETQLQREKVLESRRTEVLLSDILSTTKTAIFWKDADRRFLGANRAFLDYYGFPDESAILGKNDEDMGWHSDPDPFRRDEIRVLKNGVSTYHVHGRCLVNGETREITASKSP
jgi:PAS domain-containing protein